MNTTVFLDRAIQQADARRDEHLGRVQLPPKPSRWRWRYRGRHHSKAGKR